MIESQAGTGAAIASSRRARLAAWVYGLVATAVMGHFLLGIPIQLTDSFGNMLKLDASWRDLVVAEFHQRSYLRPFLFAELKAVYDLSGGHYFEAFRGTHVLQIGALVALLLVAFRPRTWRDAAVVPLGLAMVFGSHTFLGTINEAFPVNTFLTVVLCCLAAVNLALMEHRWWVDVLAIALVVIAALTVESGLLVWVIFVGAALVGARGVSRPALAVLVTLLAAYFYLRFRYLNVGSPGLIERSSGYGFRTLDPDQLTAIFGANPLGFYVYNIATSMISVLAGEPRAGVFQATRAALNGELQPSQVVNVVSSLAATIVLLMFGWRRRAAWWAREFDHADRLVLLFVMVLSANAVISYPYTKDVIMSPAGVFFGVATYAALQRLVADTSVNRAGQMAVFTLCTVLGVTWGLRDVGAHLNLRVAAAKVRNEWAYAYDWIAREHSEPTTERGWKLFEYLRNDAIYGHAPLRPLPLADSTWFDVD